MFTGLIEAVGRVASVESPAASAPGRGPDTGVRVRLETAMADDCAPGESIAVNGVCLTVADLAPGSLTFDLAPQTLRLTTLGRLAPGAPVNLERAMRADGRFGGHIVQGHVDGVGRIAALRVEGEAAWLEVEVPLELAAAMITRGSVALDGVSLTIASLDGGRLAVQLVPFTLAHTTFGSAASGDPVNIEADVIGKYVARLMAGMDVMRKAGTP